MWQRAISGSGGGGGGVTPDMIGKRIVRRCDNQSIADNIVTSVIDIKKVKITAYGKDYSDTSSSLEPCAILGWKTDGSYDNLGQISTTSIIDVEDYYALATYRTGSRGDYTIWVVE